MAETDKDFWRTYNGNRHNYKRSGIYVLPALQIRKLLRKQVAGHEISVEAETSEISEIKTWSRIRV